MKRIALSCAVIICTLIAVTASASLNRFAGDWKNIDPNTRGVTTLNISAVGSAVTVQAWAKCHPQDCDWGRVNGHAYAPDVSSNLAEAAETISALFRTSFSETLMIIHAVPGNRLHAEVLTRFTDRSRRSNYRNSYSFVRSAQAAALLPAPVHVSPANGTPFSHFPRRTTLAWRPVPGARSYTVEIDCYHCCQANKWCNDVGRVWKEVPALDATSYTFDFVGAQPGRWRVWAVDATGRPGTKSQWWDFRYTR